jgi:hypothetical protein
MKHFLLSLLFVVGCASAPTVSPKVAPAKACVEKITTESLDAIGEQLMVYYPTYKSRVLEEVVVSGEGELGFSIVRLKDESLNTVETMYIVAANINGRCELAAILNDPH